MNPPSMDFVTQIDADQFPTLFVRFEQLLNPSTWRRRVFEVESEINENRFLGDYLRQENRLAYALQDLSMQRQRFGQLRKFVIDSDGHYQATGFVAQFLSVHDSLPGAAARRYLILRARVAIRTNPADLRGLQFEWLIATHLFHRKFEVEFPTPEQGTFDLLITRQDLVAEVECKSVSEIGQRIHQREAREIFGIMQSSMRPLFRGLNQGLMLRVIVPQRFPSAFSERQRLCYTVRQSILSGNPHTVQDDLEVYVSHFNARGTPLENNPDSNTLQDFVLKTFGVDNKHLLVTNLSQPVILALESREPDNVVEATMKTVKDAASRQLTRKRAGMVCVKLERISAAELEELGTETGEPSALRRAASAFLNRPESAHVICLGFFSDGPVTRSAGGAVSQGGRSYFFERSESPFFNEIPSVAFGNIQDALPP